MFMIPYGKQDITQEDIDRVIEVLKSDFITQGPELPRFEKTISEYSSSKYAVAVNSATSALHIACLALDLGPGDWMWTSPNTFVASANCGLYCGAKVDFVDIDPRSYNMSVELLQQKLEVAELAGKLPKIVIPVHFAGQSCDMKDIRNLADKYGFKIIEDASHAIGGSYLGKSIGNCEFSDITIFSFHPVKIITTAEGGVATTNNELVAEKLRRLRSHGVTRDDRFMQGDIDGPWTYQQVELGFNYRMTDIQAALGCSQMKRLGEYVKTRHDICEKYNRLLSDSPLILPWQNPDSYSALHLYPVQIKDECKVNRLQVFESMRCQGVGVNVHYIPVHTQPFYKNLGFKMKDFPNSVKYYQRTISLPVFSSLNEDEQLKVVNSLKMSLS
ncbi:MAG: UDP-4-amino-4,6-dideoxy-N-acetyl-beta-L-altrosamine transaminase [Pseudomonadota bacterium]